MLKRLLILVGVVLLVIVSLFLFFELKSVRYYSCVSEADGKEFSLKLQKRENTAYLRIEKENEFRETSCEPIQGKENTYKCYLEETKENIGIVKTYLVLKEKNGALELYPAAELVISKTEKPFMLVSLNSGETFKEYRVSTVQFWEVLGGYTLEELLEDLGKLFLYMFMTDEEKWVKSCEEAGGKILDGMLCVIDKPFATCEEKNVLVSYIQEIFK